MRFQQINWAPGEAEARLRGVRRIARVGERRAGRQAGRRVPLSIGVMTTEESAEERRVQTEGRSWPGGRVENRPVLRRGRVKEFHSSSG